MRRSWGWGLGCLLVILSVSARAQEGFLCEAVSKTTNGIRLVVFDPPTNRMDVYSCSDLMGEVWSISARDLPTGGSNILSWTDLGAGSGLPVKIYSFSDPTIDLDSDGYPDARESLIFKTDASNPNSRPMRVSGLVGYNGAEQNGTIYVLSVTEESSWSIAKSVALSSPGAYTNDEIGNFSSYWFKSFRDLNTNCIREIWEPFGIYSAYSLYVTSDVSGVNITLNDQPSLWGTVNYAGGVTGNVYILAATSPDSWQSPYENVTVWQQGEDLTGGVTFASFPVGFSLTGLPVTSLYVRAFIDENYDGEYSPSEPAGQYSSSAIPVSNRVVLGAFTLGEDSDADQMPDWWEWEHGLDSQNPSDAAGDPDGDGLSNLQESLFGTNPMTNDTDQDGLSDEEEIVSGLNPFYNPLEHRLASLTFAYDDQDRLERVESPASSLTMGYDAAANLTNAVCSKGE